MSREQLPKPRTKTKSPVCETCKYLVPADETGGYCYRHPPAAINSAQSAYPPVKLLFWCGEWKAKA